MFQKNDPIYINACPSYDRTLVEEAVRWQLEKLGLLDRDWSGKRIVIKPNLVMKMTPDGGATTHPQVVAAVARLFSERGGEVLLAESPGGLYCESALRAIYRGCGMEAAEKEGFFRLNFDLSAEDCPCPDGIKSKNFHLISPVLHCDLLVNLCKLKTHGLTGMSGAMKNLFGCIPGTEKLEMHARFTRVDDFEQMLLDLCILLHQRTEVVSLCDGIVGMEGNGPTGGRPKQLGFLLSSRNPCNLDLAAAELIGLTGRVPMLQKAAERGCCPKTVEELVIEGISPKESQTPFEESDAKKKSRLTWLLTMGGGRFEGLLAPRPVVDAAKCKGCGDCLRSCPRHTIVWEKDAKKPAGRRAKILPRQCIRCFCCQELCPHRAIRIRKSLLLRITDKIRF